MSIERVAILGAGIMGAGIAQVVAQAGFPVVLRDIEQAFVDKGVSTIRKNLDRLVKKEKIPAHDADAIMSRITGTIDIAEAVSAADLVVEAVVEKMEVKRRIFEELDAICKPEAILASNTSGLSISEMAATTTRPSQVIGMHFFNPAPVMKLIELIRGYVTSDETFNACRSFAQRIGKDPIEIAEAPGFAVNRLLCPMINEAIFIYSEGIASAEDIDRGMVLGANHPIGPLALGDLIGLDTLLHIMDDLQKELGEDKYRPAPLLRKMVRAGHLGRKSGRGFFTYE